jgi:glycosyltransferase involved in cell wall biosynthesis
MLTFDHDPTISVVCPTYNSRAFALRALESVLVQTVPPFEIIVADDGSTDDTLQAVQAVLSGHPEARAQIIADAHFGAGAARNAGIRHAKGEWIAFIDSDDVWLPRKLELVMAAIRAHPEANLVCHSEEHIMKDGGRRPLDYGGRYDPCRPVGPQLFFSNLFSPSAVTCTRSLLHKAGLFDESLASWQDYDLWLRMSPWVRPFFIREVLGWYCEREGSISAGSLWRQWRCAIRVASRHREQVTIVGYLCRLLRLTGSFGARGLSRKLT